MFSAECILTKNKAGCQCLLWTFHWRTLPTPIASHSLLTALQTFRAVSNALGVEGIKISRGKFKALQSTQVSCKAEYFRSRVDVHHHQQWYSRESAQNTSEYPSCSEYSWCSWCPPSPPPGAVVAAQVIATSQNWQTPAHWSDSLQQWSLFAPASVRHLMSNWCPSHLMSNRHKSPTGVQPTSNMS